jgi:predicted DNA-binding transcriptional regulator YafY
LAALRDGGLGLIYDETTERYHLPLGKGLPLSGFTEMEALAVLSLCNEGLGSSTFPFRAAMGSAATKFEQSLPTRIRRRLKDLTGAVDISPAEWSLIPGTPDIHERLVRAVADRKAVRISYDSVLEHEVIQTKLFPYRLFHVRHTWYVVGRSSLHRQTRTFHVGRIQELELLDEKFSRPRGFAVGRYLRNAWRMIPDGPPQQIHIRFRPLVAPNVEQVRWHRTQRTKRNRDGSLDFFVRVSGLWEISWWILGYGDQAEVVSPKKLREMIAGHISNLATTYGVQTPQAGASPPIPTPHFKAASKRARGRRKR